MKYKFPQFDIEIENPSISIVKKSKPNLDIDVINIQITLEVNGSRFGVVLTDISCSDVTNADFMDLTLTALEEFKVEEE